MTALSLKARPDEDLAALTRAVLETPAARALTAQDPGISLFIQISSGSSQLKHLLIDLGMREDAVNAIQTDTESDFAVVSRVTWRDPGAIGRPDPLAIGSDIEPLFYVQLADGEVAVDARQLRPAEFHPGFSRIRF